VIAQALAESRVPASRITAVAATSGPGLPGSLLVGLAAGKALAYLLNKPFIAINHIEAHIYAAFLENPSLKPPLLALVVSGGHTELIHMKRHGSFTILGRTRDDAAGEAFDKVAKLMGLGYPGGPRIERLARRGNSRRRSFRLPVARMKDGSLDFSFSGLKTAVALAPKNDRAALAYGFQEAVIEALDRRSRTAIARTRARTFVLAGGVAANGALRNRLRRVADDCGVGFAVPPVRLCTDNGAMIACAGWFKARRKGHSDLTTPARAGWQAGEPERLARA
jgi:N6-L-threonylcarbamoyladenine synthase